MDITPRHLCDGATQWLSIGSFMPPTVMGSLTATIIGSRGLANDQRQFKLSQRQSTMQRLVLPEDQTSRLDTIPRRPIIVLRLESSVRRTPRHPVLLRIEQLNHNRLFRVHETLIVPLLPLVISQLKQSVDSTMPVSDGTLFELLIRDCRFVRARQRVPSDFAKGTPNAKHCPTGLLQSVPSLQWGI